MEERGRTEDIVSTIRKNAKKIGYDYDSLPEKDKQYLITIEESITETFELEQKAREMISKNVVSVKGVSAKTQIARQTLYNNPILKEYINYRADSFDKIDASKKDSAKDDEIRRLRGEVEAMRKRDIELEEAKRQIKDLTKQLREKEDLIAMLRNPNRSNILHIHSNKD